MNRLTPELAEARLRETNARAELLEIDIRKAKRELVPLEEVVGFINRKLSGARQQVLAMPAILGPKTNPSDPAFGIEACSVWRDGFLKFIADISLENAQDEEAKAHPTRKRIRGIGGKR
jgi:hypothetical protein